MDKKLFSRILSLIMFGLLIVMIISKYFYLVPVNEISNGLIILIIILLIIGLSESFDNFSIGRIFSMSRTINEQKKNIDTLSQEKKELFNQIVNITNSNNQKQTNANFYGVSPDMFVNYKVEKAEETEIHDKEENEKVSSQESHTPQSSPRRILNPKKIEDYIFSKYIKGDSFYDDKTFRDIKITAFQGMDPISDNAPIFDAYVNDINKDVFYEIKIAGNMMSLVYDRLYNMLTKIYYYKNTNKRIAYLHLIIVSIPNGSTKNNFEDNIERIKSDFMPAIKNGLLFIDTKIITHEEYDLIQKKSD